MKSLRQMMKLSLKTGKSLEEIKACVSKAVYETAEASYQKGQCSYKCPFCRKWHRSGWPLTFANTLRKRYKR